MRGELKGLLAVILVLCAVAQSTAAQAAVEPDISLSITKGEHSKDSHSTTQSIQLKGGQLVYDETYQGRRAPGSKPLHKVLRLKAAEVKSLLEIIRQRELLTSGNKEFELQEGFNYFDISLQIKADGKDSSITLSGNPRHPDIKTDRLFQNAEALIKEIFRIIQSQDKNLDYRSLSE